MKKLLIPFFLFLLFNSCATLINGPAKRIDIIAVTPVIVKINEKDIYFVGEKAKILVPRDIRPLILSASNDSIFHEIRIDSRNSVAYWANLYTCGIGMLIDKDRIKRYTYPDPLYIDLTNIDRPVTFFDPLFKKGEFYFHFSIPYINNFLLQPFREDSMKISTGFWGMLAGFDYYYRDNRFLNVSIGGVCDFPVPVPAYIDYSGEYNFTSSVYISISNNYRINRFSAGYGLSFSKNIWDHRYSEWLDPPPPLKDPVTRTGYSIGFIFPLYLQTGRFFCIGFLYRPSLLNVYPEVKLKYEHLISIDLAFKFPLN